MKILLTFLFLISLINSYYSFGIYKFSNYNKYLYDIKSNNNRNEVYTLIETSGFVKTLNLDNTIIYPPKTVDFNELAIVYHVKFNSRHAIPASALYLKLLGSSSTALL